MQPLAELLGSGAADKLRAALDLSAVIAGSTFTVLEDQADDGSANVIVSYDLPGEPGVVVLTVEYRLTHANYTGLQVAPALRGKGVYRQVACSQGALLAAFGVPFMVASPADERAEYLLALGGFYEREFFDGWAFCTETGKGDRQYEYRQWVTAGRPEEGEPVWHAALAASPLPGPAVY